jgi:hypothetical protein
MSRLIRLATERKDEILPTIAFKKSKDYAGYLYSPVLVSYALSETIEITVMIYSKDSLAPFYIKITRRETTKRGIIEYVSWYSRDKQITTSFWEDLCAKQPKIKELVESCEMIPSSPIVSLQLRTDKAAIEFIPFTE